MSRKMETPWGWPDEAKEMAPGIIWYSTPSHGGFGLSDERLAEMPEAIRRVKPFAGRGWYEEDCDWALVALAFPTILPAADLEIAKQAVRYSHPTVFAALFPAPMVAA